MEVLSFDQRRQFVGVFLRLPSGVKLTGARWPEGGWKKVEKHLVATRILFYAVLIFSFPVPRFLFSVLLS